MNAANPRPGRHRQPRARSDLRQRVDRRRGRRGEQHCYQELDDDRSQLAYEQRQQHDCGDKQDGPYRDAPEGRLAHVEIQVTGHLGASA